MNNFKIGIKRKWENDDFFVIIFKIILMLSFIFVIISPVFNFIISDNVTTQNLKEMKTIIPQPWLRLNQKYFHFFQFLGAPKSISSFSS